MTPPDRRAVLAGALLAAGPAKAAIRPSDEAEAALRAFLKAFEACDLPAMEAAFASDAQSFDRVPPGQAAPDLAHYRRASGMPAGMRAVAQALRAQGGAPPYQRLEPHDLLVQASDDMAVLSFHLDAPHSLGRRTVVMARRPGGWKIIHLHASNVSDA